MALWSLGQYHTPLRGCHPVSRARHLLALGTGVRSDPKPAVQVAAVDEPKLHLWETGVMRITRHPQALGQALWCAAHTAWIGSSFMAATSAALMAHHVFGCWHGDFRLRRKYGAVRDPRALVSSVSLVAVLLSKLRVSTAQARHLQSDLCLRAVVARQPPMLCQHMLATSCTMPSFNMEHVIAVRFKDLRLSVPNAASCLLCRSPLLVYSSRTPHHPSNEGCASGKRRLSTKWRRARARCPSRPS